MRQLCFRLQLNPSAAGTLLKIKPTGASDDYAAADKKTGAAAVADKKAGAAVVVKIWCCSW